MRSWEVLPPFEMATQTTAATLKAATETSYHARMRAYLGAEAKARGYELLDLQPVFIERHEAIGSSKRSQPVRFLCFQDLDFTISIVSF